MMPKYWISLLFFLVVLPAFGMHPLFGGRPAGDTEMLRNSLKPVTEHSSQRPDVITPRSQRSLARYNPLHLTFSGLMFVYQRYVSPQLPSECLFEHSCSNFSKSLIAEYGLIRGIPFTADRLMRCNRIAATDIHPLFIGESTNRVMESVSVYKTKAE